MKKTIVFLILATSLLGTRAQNSFSLGEWEPLSEEDEAYYDNRSYAIIDALLNAHVDSVELVIRKLGYPEYKQETEAIDEFREVLIAKPKLNSGEYSVTKVPSIDNYEPYSIYSVNMSYEAKGGDFDIWYSWSKVQPAIKLRTTYNSKVEHDRIQNLADSLFKDFK